MAEQPFIDTWYADIAFLETSGSDQTRVKAALWAWLNLGNDHDLSLNEIRAFLVENGFEVVSRG